MSRLDWEKDRRNRLLPRRRQPSGPLHLAAVTCFTCRFMRIIRRSQRKRLPRRCPKCQSKLYDLGQGKARSATADGFRVAKGLPA